MKKISLFILTASFVSILGLYIYEDKKSRTFDLFFNEHYHPCIRGNIEETAHNFIIDTGGAFHCRLAEKIANELPTPSIHKEFKLKNCEGQISIGNEYVADNISLFGIKFEKFFFIPTKPDFWNQGIINGDIPSIPKIKITKQNDQNTSLIGHQLLDGLNFTIDFKNQKFRLYKPGLISLFHFPYKYLFKTKKIPISYDPKIGITCNVETSLGNKSFLIDTGFSKTVLKNETASILTSDFFKISTIDFSPQVLHLDHQFLFSEFDGILGMDFFHDKVIFFDMENYYMSIK